jgi:phage/plasmid-like protein (TIGR03299 family)
MSAETSSWLNQNTLIGFTEKRGQAWHYRASDQGDEPNHYAGPIPVEDVKRRLFAWEGRSGAVYTRVNGTYKRVPGRQAISRSDTGEVLGVFADGYTIHQYDEWLLTNVSNILDDTLQIGSAGLLKGGGVAWVSIEVPENIKTPEGVEFRPNLLAATSMNGSLATTYKRVVTNVVCDNTMAAGLGEAGQTYKVKHSRYSAAKLGEAREALNVIHTVAEAFEAEVAKLCRVEVSEKAWDAFLTAWAPTGSSARGVTMADAKREALAGLYRNDERVAPWAGTAWGVMQAVNTYTHHVANVRGERAEANMRRAVTGGVDDLDTEIANLLQSSLAAV